MSAQGAEPLYVFGYGSLVFSPECPDALVGRQHALLRGHRRCFNKRSGPRACAAEDRGWPELEGLVPPEFRSPHSLALGTLPGGAMSGVLLAYDPGAGPRLFERLDRREGVDLQAPRPQWSYRRERVSVSVPGGTVQAWTYLSNPGGHWHVEELEADMVIRILLHATPRLRQARAYGVDYLLDTARALRDEGLEAPGLDALVQRLPTEVHARRRP